MLRRCEMAVAPRGLYPSATMAGSIDQIEIREDGGADRRMTLLEWSKLPLAERLNLIGSHRVRFFSSGELVPTREAMFIMNKMRRLGG